MQSSFNPAVSNRRRNSGLFGRIALMAASLALLAAARPLHAQTFVAEWPQADIGRVGPTGLAIDTVGGSTFLYVADQPAGRILKIDLASGTRVAAWGKTGNGQLEFNSPYGVAVDPVSHDLYIAERGNNRVQRITNAGPFVMGWGEAGTGPGQFSSPIGIAADAAGNVYVVDHDNDRVEKFHVQQTNGAWSADFVTAWGSRGTANGQFDAPYGITLDAQGTLWVADGGNHRIQKFDSNGRFLGSIGSYGTGNGQFITPTWVSFDANGNYYVCDTNSDPQNLAAPDIANQRIQQFSPTGTFLLKWGSYGDGNLQLKLPFDIVLDRAGNGYVSDYYNTRLVKVSVPGAAAATGGSSGSGGSSGGTAPAARFANVSARLRTNADPSRALIAGFVITGSSPKKMLIRAVGPTLSQYGVSSPLANPKLQVFSGNTPIASNDDWAGAADVGTAATAVGAFALPAASHDAAVLVSLPPGAYSAQVDSNGGDGIALVEVYDDDANSTSRVINLSTRGFVDTGDGVLVAGFVITGTAPKRVLVRGVGPGLTAYGVSGALTDPVLKLYTGGNALIAQNDDWGTGQTVPGGPAASPASDVAAAASAAGAFALTSGSKDAALVVTLQPGAYSAIVSGANGTTGAALVEVYDLP